MPKKTTKRLDPKTDAVFHKLHEKEQVIEDKIQQVKNRVAEKIRQYETVSESRQAYMAQRRVSDFDQWTSLTTSLPSTKNVNKTAFDDVMDAVTDAVVDTVDDTVGVLDDVLGFYRSDDVYAPHVSTVTKPTPKTKTAKKSTPKKTQAKKRVESEEEDIQKYLPENVSYRGGLSEEYVKLKKELEETQAKLSQSEAQLALVKYKQLPWWSRAFLLVQESFRAILNKIQGRTPTAIASLVEDTIDYLPKN